MLLVLLGMAHLLAAMLLMIWARPWWVSVVLVLGIVMSLAYESRRILRPEIGAISMSAKGEFMVQPRHGDWVVVDVASDSVVSPLVSVLGLKLPNRRFTQRMLLLPDMLDVRQYRQLRVWLKWHQHGTKTVEQERS